MRQVVKIVAGVNLVAGCLLMQGCGSYATKDGDEGAVIHSSELEDNIAIIADDAAVVADQSAAPVVAGVGAATSYEAAVADMLPATTPYTIRKGDTISAVAYKYGLRWQDVVAINPGISPNRLRIGQVIHLPGVIDLGQVRQMPAATPKKSAAPKVTPPKKAAPAVAATGPSASYVVKKGDSLSVIAVRHGTNVAAIREANGIKGDKILVGQKLIIPGATKTPAAAAAKRDTSKKAAAPTQTRPPVVESKPVEVKQPAQVVAPPPPPAVVTPEVKDVEVPAVAVPPPPAPEQPEKVDVPAADENVQMYTVKEGEDVYAIAIRWGVSPAAIKSLNNLTSNDLKAGQSLKIPAANQ